MINFFLIMYEYLINQPEVNVLKQGLEMALNEIL